MTPEKLKSTCIMFRKELEVQGASLGIMSVFDSMCSYLGGESRDLNRALAALEETEHQLRTAKEERDSQQRVCIKTMEELAEAQQTIARQRKALEQIMDVTGADYEESFNKAIHIAYMELGLGEGAKTDA